MGFWDRHKNDDIKNARGTKGGVYFTPGNYLVRIDRCKEISTRGQKDVFIAECTVLESDNDKTTKGSHPSVYIEDNPAYPNMALGNIADLMRAALASKADQLGAERPEDPEEIEIDMDVAKAVTGDDNILAGVILQVNAFNKKTLKDKDFTRLAYTVPDNVKALQEKYAE